MRLFAIGDIHGCSQALDTFLETIQLQSDDLIVTLGDYVNKGSDSKGVIDRLLKLHQSEQLIPLKGNHELKLLEARANPAKCSELVGAETLNSYRGKQQPSLADIPESHWNFIEKTCLSAWETRHQIFVHANVAPDLPLTQQPDHELFWQKFDDPQPHYSGKTMICGHTSQKDGLPLNLGYAICIDTWACGNGWLTALDVDSGQIWQTNQLGQHRTSHIEVFKLKTNRMKQLSFSS